MMKDAIETAIKMETDAIAFYDEATRRASHPFGREMFKGFIKDETRHLKMLQSMFKGLDFDIESVRPKDTIKTVFSMFKDEMMQRVKAMANEMEAVNIALKFEKEGFDFYKNSGIKGRNCERKRAV